MRVLLGKNGRLVIGSLVNGTNASEYQISETRRVEEEIIQMEMVGAPRNNLAALWARRDQNLSARARVTPTAAYDARASS
jgi:hypothetical protein